jgi:hypothetical protein
MTCIAMIQHRGGKFDIDGDNTVTANNYLDTGSSKGFIIQY